MLKYQGTATITEKSLNTEDGGMALILEDDFKPTPEAIAAGYDACFFVRLQSWDEEKRHALMKTLLGNKVRVTVELLPY
jgi:hypothetical protein